MNMQGALLSLDNKFEQFFIIDEHNGRNSYLNEGLANVIVLDKTIKQLKNIGAL